MPSTTINFADVDSFEPLPEGTYDIEVDKVEVRQNKAKDGEYLNWELVVIDGEYENRRLWMITSLKPQALFRLKQVFEDMGIIDDDDEEMDLEWDEDVEPSTSGGPRLLYPELEGLEAVAQVKNEMYDGRERNRVENLFGPDKKQKKRKAKPASTNGTSRSRKRDEEDEDERPRRSSRSKRARDDDEPKSRNRGRRDVDEDEDDDDEDEEVEERPSRRSSGTERTKSRSRERARRRVR